MSTDNCRGDFLWYELMSKDPNGSVAFYPGVTGWTTTAMPNPMGGGDYLMFANEGAPFAGCMKLPPEAEAMQAPSHWMGYIGTPDVDATVAQATALGASVYMPPTDIPSVGRMAVLADPQGGTFSVFCPAPREGDPQPQPKAPIAWHELMTSDIEAAGRSTPRFSAGRRSTTSTWARWACTACLARAPSRSAA
ncbi:MAG: VOC family protein [Deltaproteobacteria bacterium]|nr:VOC family protein [Deltaproteobacteria bacterium]